MVTGKACPNCDMLKMIINHMKLPEPEIVDAESAIGREIIKETAARGIPVLARIQPEGEHDKLVVEDYMIGSHNDNKVKEIYNGTSN